MKRKIIMATLCVTFITAASFIAMSTDENIVREDNEKLHGKWISVDINGSSILFEFVDTIELDVLKEMRFKGTATLIEGSTISKTGDYRIVQDEFYAKVDGMKQEEKAIFWFKDKHLFIEDKSLNLTVKFKRKPKGDGSSDSWF
jgi:hypothetical protein